tara:strand:+ start:305 stop:913 length:609 start_codon:yes stop_codon:yes gene_type:complete
MVKNNIGGNKSKKFANKNFNIQDRATRFAKENGELYAYVEKLMGNNMCHVMCIDGHKRTCVIRGKFLGKGKRDSLLCRGKWILVGIREWENNNKDSEKEKCDLLEVYTDVDKQRLQNDNTCDFSGFLKNNETEDEYFDDSIKFTNETNDNTYFSFSDEDEDEDEDEAGSDSVSDSENELKKYNNINIKKINDSLNKIDIDDI